MTTANCGEGLPRKLTRWDLGSLKRLPLDTVGTSNSEDVWETQVVAELDHFYDLRICSTMINAWSWEAR